MIAVRRRDRGMTLVELMVAVAIGLFLVAVMGSIYLGSKGTFVAQDAVARLQENGRFAVDTIATDLRTAGYRGCQQNSPIGGGPLNTLASAAGTELYNYAEGVWASHPVNGTWTPPLPPELAGIAGISTSGDVIMVRRPTSAPWSLVNQMTPNPSAPLVVTATQDIQPNDLLLVSDCTGAAVLQASSIASAGPNMSIAHVVGAGNPGMTTAALDHVYDTDAVVQKITTTAYYLAVSGRRPGVLSLYACPLACLQGGTGPVELVTGVQNLGLTIGLNTTPSSGNLSATQYQTPDTVATWNQAVSVKLEMVLVSADDHIATAPQPYTFANTLVTPTDQRLRVVMATTATLRNSLQ